MFKRIFGGVSRVGNVIASVFLAGIMFLMMGEIIGRYIFGSPIPGTFEIVAASMAVLCTIGFAFALEQGRHIRVRIVTQRLPPSVQSGLLLVAYFAGFVIAGVLCWQLIISAGYSVAIREYTSGLVHVPVYVPRIIFAFAVLLFCLGFGQLFIGGIKKQH